MSFDSLLAKFKEDLEKSHMNNNEFLLKKIESQELEIKEKCNNIEKLSKQNENLTGEVDILIEKISTLEIELETALSDSEKLKSLVEKYSTQSNDIAKVKEYEESIKNIKLSKIYILVDPRIKDAGLPNDASVTYDYGARSFITDAYDNFTWRNGTWFKITNELKFKSDISDSFTKKDVQGHKIYRTLINDSYNSIIVNNNRYFIKSRNIICKNGKYEFCSYQEPNKAVVICPRTKEEFEIYATDIIFES